MKGIFRNKNFNLIISGKLVSLMGNSIFDIALMWYVLSKYGKSSGTMLALMMVMAILPTVILGSLSGVLIDRYNKKVLMIVADVISGIVVLVIFLLMKNSMLNSVVLLLSIGILSVTSSTVRIAVNSIIPDLFKDKELYDANAANQFIERGTSLLGYALGGGLIALTGVQNAILFNGISFIICAGVEIFIILPKKITGVVIVKKQSIMKDFKEVATFLKYNKTILRISLIFTVVNFFWDPAFNIALPYVLKNIFNISSTNFGLIIASLPLGFCVGAIYFSKRSSFLKNKFVIFNSILGANTMFVLFSIPIILSGYLLKGKWTIYYFMMSLLILGIFSAAINISASVAMQTMIPENIRGKFMGIVSSLSAGLLPLGGVIVGALIGKINFSIIFIVSILAVYAVIIIVPKNSYSYE